MDEFVDSTDALFSDNTVVIHISGNKENSGKIAKTNQSLTKVFGYNKTEVVGHSISILMPLSFAKRHDDFLERFYITGHNTIFNKERILYGLHRNGYCFSIKLLVTQMPNLTEGIQYVGMLRQNMTEFDYIITNHSSFLISDPHKYQSFTYHSRDKISHPTSSHFSSFFSTPAMILNIRRGSAF